MLIKHPAITVIMPVYNTEIYLREAIHSVINQSFKNWELICVDDGSTDNCLNILREFEALDERIIVFTQRNSGRAAAARNVALNHASGKYIHTLDSDDLLSSNCLACTYEIAINSNADFVIPDLLFFKDNISNITYRLVGFHGDRQVQLAPKEAFEASLSWGISGVGLYKSELVKKFRYDEAGMNGDEYTTRLLFLNCNKIAFSKGVYFYRQHDGSITKKVSVKIFDTIATDFRILGLVNEYKLNKKTTDLCKKNIIDNTFGLVKYLTDNKNYFTTSQIADIRNNLKQYYNKIDKSFIRFEGKVLKYLFKKALFLDFRILIIFVSIQKTFYLLYKNLFNYK